jgi:heat shock transcription factor, other eukaryote
MGSECKGYGVGVGVGVATSPQQEQEQAGAAVAPFVAKTFHMVSDPATDAVVRWGGASNTFHVLDPATFSDYLLPSYFKHRNFASFVRQLNTYVSDMRATSSAPLPPLRCPLSAHSGLSYHSSSCE